jgi:hypothetical protein
VVTILGGQPESDVEGENAALRSLAHDRSTADKSLA